MKLPQIQETEARELIKNSYLLIKNSLSKYITSGILTEEEAEGYLLKHGKINTGDYKVFLIGIRGYYKNTMGKPLQNDRGIYDDAMIVLAPDFYKTYNANTDPDKYKTGIGTVLPGWHFYKKGKHGISSSNPYDAFRPLNPEGAVPGIRDGHNGIKKIYFANIHKGGVRNVNSRGCQTVQASQWPEFQKSLYKLMTENNQNALPYLLIEY